MQEGFNILLQKYRNFDKSKTGVICVNNTNANNHFDTSLVCCMLI